MKKRVAEERCERWGLGGGEGEVIKKMVCVCVCMWDVWGGVGLPVAYVDFLPIFFAIIFSKF